MESSKDAAFLLSVQILGAAGTAARDYDRTVMLALERLRASGIAITDAGVLSFTVPPDVAVSFANAALTGIPTAPTAAPGTNTTQIATTAFTTAAVGVETAARTAADALLAGLPGTSAPTTTGTQTALAIPAGTGDLTIYANNATLLTVQGIVAGTSGQRLTIVSKGAGQVDFAHLHASGTALGKLKLFATTGLTSLAAGSGVAIFQYDATVTQWRLIEHEQGAWITPAFAAGDYTGPTWTVEAGDVDTMKYRLRGRTLAVTYRILTTTVSGTPTSLIISNGQWGGFTCAVAVSVMGIGSNAGGATEAIFSQTTAAGTTITNNQLDAGTWSNATNTTFVVNTVEFEVQ